MAFKITMSECWACVLFWCILELCEVNANTLYENSQLNLHKPFQFLLLCVLIFASPQSSQEHGLTRPTFIDLSPLHIHTYFFFRSLPFSLFPVPRPATLYHLYHPSLCHHPPPHPHPSPLAGQSTRQTLDRLTSTTASLVNPPGHAPKSEETHWKTNILRWVGTQLLEIGGFLPAIKSCFCC